MNKTFHSHSLKKITEHEINISTKLKFYKKIFEFLDDHTYGNSTNIGIYIKVIKDQNNELRKVYLYLFMDDPIKDVETVTKLLQWRRSGDSNEIGHQGGGNKRIIFGMNAINVHISSNIGNNQIIEGSVNVDDLYKLSINDNICEETFRKESVSSKYITVPSIKDNSYETTTVGWYKETYDNIGKKFEFNPNYLLRFNLNVDNIPDDFQNEEKWNLLIKQISSKNYKIKINYSNEFINENIEKIENIDLIGLNISDRTNEKIYKLFYNNNEFIINYGDKFINLEKKTINNNINLNYWGEIISYCFKKNIFSDNLKKFNNGISNMENHTANHFYGIYFNLNNKNTDYKALGGILPTSKNNKLGDKLGDNSKSSTAYFRMVVKPDIELCKKKEVLEKLVLTNTIKANTIFIEKSDYKKIINIILSLYKTNNNLPMNTKKTEKKRKKKEKKPESNFKNGAIYLVYFGWNLYKFGHVGNIKGYNKRFNQHKRDSIKNVKEYCNEDIDNPFCSEYLKIECKKSKEIEEKIKNIIKDDKDNKFEWFENLGDKNEILEYFYCEDEAYIQQKLIPSIKNLLSE